MLVPETACEVDPRGIANDARFAEIDGCRPAAPTLRRDEYGAS
jgi:hypothetical protein